MRGFFQKNCILSTILFGCNILLFIFLLSVWILFNILYLNIINVICFIIYTAIHIFVVIYNHISVDSDGITFRKKNKRIIIKWDEVKNIEIKCSGIGRNPAYEVVIFCSGQNFKFIISGWGVELFKKNCPKYKLVCDKHALL